MDLTPRKRAQIVTLKGPHYTGSLSPFCQCHLVISSSRFSFSAASPPSLGSNPIVVIAPLDNPDHRGLGYS